MDSSVFSSISDYRVTGRCKYRLDDLLSVAVLTHLCGGGTPSDMHVFAATRAREFGLFSDTDGTPSADTFERLVSALSPDALERCVVDSGRDLLDTLREKQVVIDGKKLRGTSPKSKGAKGNYLMNAFVSENHLLVAQEPLTDKDNEIKAIPRILEKLDIEEAVVSIDAIGTQVDIAEQILVQKGHYFLAVKENQRSLHEAVKDAFRYNAPAGTASEMESDHGRIENRTCDILPADLIEDKDVLARWPSLKTLARIKSEVYRDGQDIVTYRYYISDEDFPRAAYYNMLARGHWSIENQLHWHLDVTFKEDASRSRKGFAAQNLSLLKKLALQIARNHDDKLSIRKRLFRAALDSKYLMRMLLNYKF